MRYELKIIFPENAYDDVMKRIACSSFFIREIFTERLVNNIYFDTPGFSDYLSNYIGSSTKMKLRIRWYGKMTGYVDNPTLELKYKIGLAGGKKSVSLPAFQYDKTFSYEAYRRLIESEFQSKNSDSEKTFVIGELFQRNPSLANRYSRRYFLTSDGTIRLTLDRDIYFFNPKTANLAETNLFGCNDPRTVLEVKFPVEKATEAENLINNMGFRVNKNSKYIYGIDAVYFNKYA